MFFYYFPISVIIFICKVDDYSYTSDHHTDLDFSVFFITFALELLTIKTVEYGNRKERRKDY